MKEVNAQDYQKDKTTGKLKLREKPLVRTRTDGLSCSLLLAVNARIMLTRNVNVEDGLVNGAIGHISHFEFGKGQQWDIIQGVGVIFDCKKIGTQCGTRTPNGNIVVIQRIQEDIKENNSKNIVRHQFPLKLSWACTAHKVQGMTTYKVVVNLDRAFAAGQAYVALSRLTSKDGLFIETLDEKILNKKVYADPDVKASVNTMRKFIPNGIDQDRDGYNFKMKSVLLFNVQSIRAHIQDFKSDCRLKDSDVLCLTETWLRDNENMTEMEIADFTFFNKSRKSCYDGTSELYQKLGQARGGGVGLYVREKENIKVHDLPFNNIEGIGVELCEHNIILIGIYRPVAVSVCFFLEQLQNVVSFFQERKLKCIIIGDFNEDAKVNGPIQNCLQSPGFEQKVPQRKVEQPWIMFISQEECLLKL